MASEKDKDKARDDAFLQDTSLQAQHSATQAGVQQNPVAAEQAAIAAIGREARHKKLDESRHPARGKKAGGRYKVGGRWVNAEGEEHEDQESE